MIREGRSFLYNLQKAYTGGKLASKKSQNLYEQERAAGRHGGGMEINMILIQNGTLVRPEGSLRADILIDGEKIVRIDEHIEAPDGCTVKDASGKLVFPGFIDAHTHFDLHVAGTVTIDDFSSGTKAEAAGGTTTIVDFGTAYPGESLNEGLDNWFRKAECGCSCDYGFHQTITEWNDSISAEIPDMIERGASTFKIYMTYDTQIDDASILKVLQRLRECGTTTGCHCENSGLIDALREEYAEDDVKKRAVSSHYLTRPAAAEAEAIGRYCHLAEVADEPVIDVHLTCEEGLEEIRAARKRGQKVYVETCPQYLVMDDSLYERGPFEEASKYVCAPPLRKKADQDALWNAIRDGEIQTVSTDHCSFTVGQKKLGKDDFRKIPGGMPGAETRGAVLYSEGVAKGRISKEKMCEVLCENPARLYGMYPQKGTLSVGSDADIVILDPGRKYVISAENQVSRCDYAPLEGMEISCVIEEVYLRGTLIARDGQVVCENQGRYVKRALPELF